MRYVRDRQERPRPLCAATKFAGEFRVPKRDSGFLELLPLPLGKSPGMVTVKPRPALSSEWRSAGGRAARGD
jgi:hypothetical protein